MHPADIKAHLAKAGTSQSEIARALVGRSGKAVTPGAVWLVVEGLARSARIAEAISKAIQLPVRAIFPGRYPALEKMQAIESRGGFAAVLDRSATKGIGNPHDLGESAPPQVGGVAPLASGAAKSPAKAKPRRAAKRPAR